MMYAKLHMRSFELCLEFGVMEPYTRGRRNYDITDVGTPRAIFKQLVSQLIALSEEGWGGGGDCSGTPFQRFLPALRAGVSTEFRTVAQLRILMCSKRCEIHFKL